MPLLGSSKLAADRLQDDARLDYSGLPVWTWAAIAVPKICSIENALAKPISVRSYASGRLYLKTLTYFLIWNRRSFSFLVDLQTEL